MYRLIRNSLFLFPAEGVHHFAMDALKALGHVGIIRNYLRNQFTCNNSTLAREVFGIHFKNPVGLAAGFDKNARYLDELELLGFGAVEIGTVTPIAQAGNDQPRLFRLPHDQALINRMGFNNDGVKQIAARLRKWKAERLDRSRNTSKLVIGGNIGKNKVTPNEDAWKDYEICFRELFDTVDYFVVNVSSPNTPGLRELQEKDALKKILGHLQTINQQQPAPKPILLKIAPDLSIGQIDDVIDLSIEIKLDGLVVTNTTLDRSTLSPLSAERAETIGMGGLSGKPLQKKSTDILRYIYRNTNGSIPLIASGGIFTGDDAKEKMDVGASLVQVWTGFIYEGPSIAKNICKRLEI